MLRVVYLIFNEGYTNHRAELTDEALRLGRLLTTLMPDDAEVWGLFALMALHDARAAARVRDGRFVALTDQDRTLWDAAAIVTGRAALDRALRLRRPGAYQLHAAITALQMEDPVDWAQVAALYGALAEHEPTPVVELNRATALGFAEGAEAGLAALAPLTEALDGYQPFHAARAEFLRRPGDDDRARGAYERAIELSTDEVEREELRRRLSPAVGLTVIPPGGGEVVGDKPGRRVEILSDRDPVHATLSRFGPGMEGADLHVHYHHTDFFYVLEGELTVRLGAEDRQVRSPPVAGLGAAGGRPRLPQRERRRHALPELPRARVPLRGLHALPARRRAARLRPAGPARGRGPPDRGGARRGGRGDRRGRHAARGSRGPARHPRARRDRAAPRPRAVVLLRLEGDLLVTHGAEEAFAPAGSWVQVPAGHEHAVDGLFLNVTAPSSTA